MEKIIVAPAKAADWHFSIFLQITLNHLAFT
jgi:hypothetical protein